MRKIIAAAIALAIVTGGTAPAVASTSHNYHRCLNGAKFYRGVGLKVGLVKHCPGM